MNPCQIPIVALLIFVSGLLGFLLQWLLPVQVVADAKGMVGSITGSRHPVARACARPPRLDELRRLHDPEPRVAVARAGDPAARFRARAIWAGSARRTRSLREAVVHARDRLWGGRSGGVAPYAQARADLEDICRLFRRPQAGRRPAAGAHHDRQAVLHSGHPDDPAHEPAIGDPVPKLLLFVVVGWSALLFLSFGFLNPFNPSASPRSGAWLDRRRQRHFHDSRIQPALFRPGPHFAGRRRQPDRDPWPLTAPRRASTSRNLGQSHFPGAGPKRRGSQCRASGR